MKLKKILEKAKNYLFLIQNNEDIKKRKIEKLRDKIEDKILKLDSYSTPNGIRTRIFGLRDRLPNH